MQSVFIRSLDKAQRKLKLLNSASNINDLRSPPGNKLESLKGDRADQHSIRINDQWRIALILQDLASQISGFVCAHVLIYAPQTHRLFDLPTFEVFAVYMLYLAKWKCT